MFCQTRNRTRLEDIVYAIHLYFLGLSLRNTSIALSRFVKSCVNDKMYPSVN